MKKTKLICTIGPSCMDEEKLKDLILSGMNVARLNLSHCSHDFAEKVVHRIRNLNKKLGTNVGIIVDTKGPEIRVGTFKDDAMVLNEGDTVILTPDKADGTGGRINISQRKLSLDLDIDTKILLDEGNMELIVTGIENANITCRVVRGGVLKNNKSINVPKVDLNIDFLSITDKSDILFASSLNVDFISLSFVRNANDVLDVNDMLISEKNEHTQIISKIECQSALDDLENISIKENFDVSEWDVSNVTNMSHMFNKCIKFDCDLSNWNVNKVKYMSAMFAGCENFNCDLSNWDVSNVENMAGVFSKCESFKGKGLEKWNVSNVKRTDLMFNYCINFDGKSIENWNVSNVLSARSMFYSCENLNCDLSNWDVSNILDMTKMFYNCTSFEGIGIEKWDVSSAKYIDQLFFNCNSLKNNKLKLWNTINVKDAYKVFDGCTSLKNKPRLLRKK